MSYINLRISTSSSLKAGIVDTEKLVGKIAKNPDDYSPYVAITNANNMLDYATLDKDAKKKGITPIATVELDFTWLEEFETEIKEGFDTRVSVDVEKMRHSLLMVAKSYEGYQNLCRLQTLLFNKSDNPKRRAIKTTDIAKFPELLNDVYVLSGGLNSGESAQQHKGAFLFQQFTSLIDLENHKNYLISQGKSIERVDSQINDIYELIEEHMVFWRDITNGNYFVELQRQGTPLENEYIQFIVPIANKLGIPVIATHNVYFLEKNDYERHETMMAYRGRYSVYTPEEQRLRIANVTPENYLKTNQEIETLFSDIPVAVENAYFLAKDCGFELKPYDGYLMPKLQDDTKSIDELFEKSANDGLDEIMLQFFKSHVDKYKKDSQVNIDDFDTEADYLDYKNKHHIVENKYFHQFDEWRNSGFSLDTHSLEEVLTYIKTTNVYKKYKERLDYEAGFIKQLKFSSYFFVVSDMVKYAKGNDISVGLGRGSGAGSLVAYAMKITNVDPFEFDLLFERFLNPERVSMPDFDIDFDTNGRKKVIQYLIDKYNSLGKRMNDELSPVLEKYIRSTSVAQIATKNMMSNNSSMEVAGNVFGHLKPHGGLIGGAKELNAGQELTDEQMEELIDLGGVGSLEVQDNSEAKSLALTYGGTFRKLHTIANGLLGQTRSFGNHASGVLISPYKLDETTSIMINDDNEVIAQETMKTAEGLGLIKFDILGLSTLTFINEVRQQINITRVKRGLPAWSNDEMFDEINFNDQNVYENIFQTGRTSNIFQMESGGFVKTMESIKPTHFDDIVAAIALFRPGPKDFIPEYADVKHGRKKMRQFITINPKVQDIFAETNGIPVYQEQIMLAMMELANFSLGEADLLRRAIGKKDKELFFQQRDMVLERVKTIYTDENPEKVQKEVSDFFAELEGFASYCFNKSHAAAYAKITFMTAWLKHYYPAEFYTGHLRIFNTLKRDEIPALIRNAIADGVPIQPTINVNESNLNYTLNDKGEIVLPLNVKMGNESNQFKLLKIIDIRKNLIDETGQGFTSVTDFVSKCLDGGIKLSSKELSIMIKSGAFNNLHKGEYAVLLNNMDKLIKAGVKRHQNDANINPVYKYLPAKFLNIKPISHTEVITLDHVPREIPLSKQLEQRYQVFNYLPDYQESKLLYRKYREQLSQYLSTENKNLDLKHILPTPDSVQANVLHNASKQVSSIRMGDSGRKNVYQSDNVMTMGVVVGFKKTKESADLTIQIDGQIIHIVSRDDEVKNHKFELMTPYVFLMDYRINIPNTEITSDFIEVSDYSKWHLKDFFTMDNFIKQLSGSLQNESKMPKLKIGNMYDLMEKYGDTDIESQTQEIVQQLYQAYGIHEKYLDEFSSYLERDNGDKLIASHPNPIEFKLPNGKVIGVNYNDEVFEVLNNNNIQIQMNFEPVLLNELNQIKPFALEGNLQKTLNVGGILDSLNENVDFKKIISHLDMRAPITNKQDSWNSNQNECLLYGKITNIYRQKGDEGKRTDNVKSIIIIDDTGEERHLDAVYGNLGTHDIHELGIKLHQDCLFKVKTYWSQKDNEYKYQINDIYSNEDVLELMPTLGLMKSINLEHYTKIVEHLNTLGLKYKTNEDGGNLISDFDFESMVKNNPSLRLIKFYGQEKLSYGFMRDRLIVDETVFSEIEHYANVNNIAIRNTYPMDCSMSLLPTTFVPSRLSNVDLYTTMRNQYEYLEKESPLNQIYRYSSAPILKISDHLDSFEKLFNTTANQSVPTAMTVASYAYSEFVGAKKTEKWVFVDNKGNTLSTFPPKSNDFDDNYACRAGNIGQLCGIPLIIQFDKTKSGQYTNFNVNKFMTLGDFTLFNAKNIYLTTPTENQAVFDEIQDNYDVMKNTYSGRGTLTVVTPSRVNANNPNKMGISVLIKTFGKSNQFEIDNDFRFNDIGFELLKQYIPNAVAIPMVNNLNLALPNKNDFIRADIKYRGQLEAFKASQHEHTTENQPVVSIQKFSMK